VRRRRNKNSVKIILGSLDSPVWVTCKRAKCLIRAKHVEIIPKAVGSNLLVLRLLREHVGEFKRDEELLAGDRKTAALGFTRWTGQSGGKFGPTMNGIHFKIPLPSDGKEAE
jgi:hypothetical protein